MNALITVIERGLIIVAVSIVLDLYLTHSLKKNFPLHAKKYIRIYWIISLLVLTFGLFGILSMGTYQGNMARINMYFMGVFASSVIFKLLISVFLVLEDFVRIGILIFRYCKNEMIHIKHQNKNRIIGRRKFVMQTATIVAAIPFGGLLYGMFQGRYNLKVHQLTLHFDDLPVAFDGLTITQFSDLHIGSFDHFAKGFLEHVADEIQKLNSDIIVFNGDIVNSRATEMDGWYEVFNHLNAPMGKFAVLGNHDYGDYVNWKTNEDKIENLQHVKGIHPEIGFHLLLNEHVILERDNQKVFLIGVENWGAMANFPKFGDIKLATNGISSDEFKILLSHDPSHWDAKVLRESAPCQFTMSGHTHGFQMGVEIPGFRWSPSKYLYKQWAGLYQDGKNYIYVNRGLGTTGYPGRIGIWPEIIQFTLKRNENLLSS